MNYAKVRKVLLFSIFLSTFLGTYIFIYGQTGYEVGTNKVTRDIYFRLLVQDSLLVVPESVNLDFGDILKGSTDTKRAETKINVEAGVDVKNVKASYEGIGEVQTDGSRKIQIQYQAENVPAEQYVKGVAKVIETTGIETIDVYMLPFESSYTLSTNVDKNTVDIPVKAEIRGIGEARLGKYAGNIRVQIEVVTTNAVEGVVSK